MSTSKKTLRHYAHARSGDKGSDANIGVIAYSNEDYEYLKEKLSTEIVKDFFSEICLSEVKRYELPNLRAFNFILKGVLGEGGGSVSLRSDAQGKALGEALLHLDI
ncbi:MAG TPA: hypothetical protein PKA63_02165 [Oligoflexia bacterium]|nr:hypothetical protein [Oligoflexia bacterium]HMP47456.1 hypothetical protein [Oligoflexia bacterium]